MAFLLLVPLGIADYTSARLFWLLLNLGLLTLTSNSALEALRRTSKTTVGGLGTRLPLLSKPLFAADRTDESSCPVWAS